MNKSYTVTEAATQLGLSAKTLRRWEETGRFHSTRTLGGQRRYSTEDLQVLDAISHNIIASDQELLTPDVASRLLGISIATLNRYEQTGKIHSFVTSENTYYIKSHLDSIKSSLEPEPAPTFTTSATPPAFTTSAEPLVATPNHLQPRVVDPRTTTFLSHHDLKLILINLMVTTLIVVFYHLVTPRNPATSIIPAAPIVTPAPKPLVDPTANLKTRELLLMPTAKPLTPTAGTLYFDAGTQTFNFYDGVTWLSVSSPKVSSPSATPNIR